MKLTRQLVTLETRLPRDLDAATQAGLSAYADLFSRASRRYFAAQKHSKVDKKTFMAEHGLTGRQFNAVRVSVDGMVDSQLSNLPNYALQCEAKAEGLGRRIAQKRAQAERSRSRARAEKLWAEIKQMTRRRQGLLARAEVFHERAKAKDVRICFGGRRRFNAQHFLAENGHDSHAAWQADWRAARAAQFFVLGSRDENAGNQGCTLIGQDDGRYTLRLRLPNHLQAEHGQYLFLTDIEFPYRAEWLEAARLNNLIRAEKQREHAALKRAGQTEQTANQYLADAGQALSYRFVRDRKGWRVLVTTDLVVESAVADTTGGVIGVDFNADHIAVAELGDAGAKVGLYRHDLADLQATSRQNRTQLQAAAKAVVDRAVTAGKPVVIEKLSFRGKRAGLQKKEAGAAGYHRMLSRLSHKAFTDALKMQALRRGVAVIEANPAYTSFIGKLKYGRETEFDTHQAAAWVIGRRGMGKRDGLPSLCAVRPATRTRAFVAPEDARKDDPRELQRAYRAFSQWCKVEWAAWRRCQSNWQRSQVPAELEFPF